MPVPLPYTFSTIDTSGLQDAVDSSGDRLGKAIPVNYLDQNFQRLANALNIGPSAPSSPFTCMFWLDTSQSPAILKVYDGSSWQVAGGATGGGGNADTLDGFHASMYPQAYTIPVSRADGIIDLAWHGVLRRLETTGYVALVGGILVNWGYKPGDYNTNGTISYPLSYQYACIVVASVYGTVSDVGDFTVRVRPNPTYPLAQFDWVTSYNGQNGNLIGFHWIAVGY